MDNLFPLVELAVVLLTDAEGRFLMDYNKAWGSFTFPMTKLGDQPSITPDQPRMKETPRAAAARAAAEVLGRPLDPNLLAPVPFEVPSYNQSGRDGQWRHYAFNLFGLTVNAEPKPLPGHTAVWLTRAELEILEPLSLTVRKILDVM